MEYLGVAVGLGINIIILAYGYGRVTSRIHHNTDMIKEHLDEAKVMENRIDGKLRLVEDHCEAHRREYKVNGDKLEGEIFRKLDLLKDLLNDKFHGLSVQVAKLEARGVRQEKRAGEDNGTT